MSDLNKYSVNIFSSREEPSVLYGAIRHALQALSKASGKSQLNIILNGNKALFDTLVNAIRSNELVLNKGPDVKVQVHFIPFGDKANAWNQYIHEINAPSEYHVFIDGYVELYPDTLSIIENEYSKSPYIAATGVPSQGKSAKKVRQQMLEQGGIQGNLCIFTDHCMKQLAEKSFRLSLKMYRTDPTIGAAINFNFDPSEYEWDPHRIRVIPELTWKIDDRSMFSLSDLTSQLKRRKRQIKGDIINKSVSNLLGKQKRSIDSLPRTVTELCQEHLNMENYSFFQRLTNPLLKDVIEDLVAEGKKLEGLDERDLKVSEVEQF